MYHFTKHNKTIYEGQINRLIADKLVLLLNEANIKTEIIYKEWQDTSVHTRIKEANEIAKKYDRTVLVSLHSNAVGISNAGESLPAQGWEVYIAPNSKAGLRLAKSIDKASRQELGEDMVWRANGPHTGTAVKEARFALLIRTTMPAVLIENGFFTNWGDAQKLLDENYQWRSAKSTAKAIQNYLKRNE